MRASRSTTWISLGFLVLLFSACGSGGGGGGGGAPGGDTPLPAEMYVDTVSGSDANDGSPGNPMSTITRALANAVAGDTIHVAPGAYNSEALPLVVPAGVTLLGAGEPSPTVLSGVGRYGPGSNHHATIVAHQDAVVAGFHLYNDVLETPSLIPCGIIVQGSMVPSHPGATIRNNTVEGPPVMIPGERVGILCLGSANVHRVEGNIVRLYPVGIVFLGGIGGGGVRIEGNFITNNMLGITLHAGNGADLGGGEWGSGGMNELGCNSVADLGVYSGVTQVPAQNNRWDIFVAGQFGVITNPAGAAIDRTGATQVFQVCL